jgi:hypothetical protein
MARCDVIAKLCLNGRRLSMVVAALCVCVLCSDGSAGAAGPKTRRTSRHVRGEYPHAMAPSPAGLPAEPLLSQFPYLAAQTDQCTAYDDDFQEASRNYGVPSNLLIAMARVESGNCDQGARNPVDGGCGIMQLTGSTRTSAAAALGVAESALCENTAAAARLNILGGAAVLNSFKCWNSPRVLSDTSFTQCAQERPPYARSDHPRAVLRNDRLPASHQLLC